MATAGIIAASKEGDLARVQSLVEKDSGCLFSKDVEVSPPFLSIVSCPHAWSFLSFFIFNCPLNCAL